MSKYILTRQACRDCGSAASTKRRRIGAVVCFECGAEIKVSCGTKPVGFYVELPRRYKDTLPWMYVPMRLVNCITRNQHYILILRPVYADKPATLFKTLNAARQAIKYTLRRLKGDDAEAMRASVIRPLVLPIKPLIKIKRKEAAA